MALASAGENARSDTHSTWTFDTCTGLWLPYAERVGPHVFAAVLSLWPDPTSYEFKGPVQ